ncbi:MAG TPA: FecR domain-containing protein [Myxococcota bacterium]|nr:FecR domain-containing protein [Myxococcota bacterium]
MRDVLTVLVVAVAVLALGLLGYRLFFGDEALDPLTIRRVEGDVRHEHEGARSAAEVGGILLPDDRLLAGEGGRAVLSFGEDSQLVVDQSSALRVLGEGSEGVRVELEDGRVEATVRRGGPVLDVVTGDREVRADEGTFTVARDDDSTWVQLDDGELSLTGFGEVQALRAGEAIVANDGGAATRLDEGLLLEVSWPEKATREESVEVAGTTDPGARVRIEGGYETVEVLADNSGSWRVEVRLREGDNALRVLAVDPLGRTRESPYELLRDTKPPTAEFQVGGL